MLKMTSDKQANRQDKNNMPPIIRGHKNMTKVKSFSTDTQKGKKRNLPKFYSGSINTSYKN